MGGGRVAMAVALIIVMVVAAVLQSSEAATYKVGDANGWTIPDDSSFYSTWASEYPFHINDNLEFDFTSGSHTVAEVSQSAYDNCVTKSPIAKWTTGPATVTLNSTGSRYFICTIGAHCDNGQKVTIKVSSSSGFTPTTAASTALTPPSSTSSVMAAAATSVAVFGLAYVVGLL